MTDDQTKKNLEGDLVTTHEPKTSSLDEEIADFLGEGFATGQKVKVEMENGMVEDDWQLTQVYGGKIMVKKRNEYGVMMSSLIDKQRFLQLNSPLEINIINTGDKRLTHIYEARGQDDIFEIFKGKLQEDGIIDGAESPEILLYIVGSALNEVKRKGVDFIHKAGISSGNPLLIYKGDNINLDDLLSLAGGKENMKSIVERAGLLSKEHLEALRKISEEESIMKKSRVVPTEVSEAPDLDDIKNDLEVKTALPEESRLQEEAGEHFLEKEGVGGQKEEIQEEKIEYVPSPLSSQEEEVAGVGMQEEIDKITKSTLDKDIENLFSKKAIPGVGQGVGYMEDWRRLRNQDMQKLTEYVLNYERGVGGLVLDSDPALLLWKLVSTKREMSGIKPIPTESVESYLLRSTREIISKDSKMGV